MRYMLLVHHNEQVLSKLPDGELQKMRAESVRLANQLNSSGQYLDAAPLHSASTATSVQVRDNGKRFVTDGPFAERENNLVATF